MIFLNNIRNCTNHYFKLYFDLSIKKTKKNMYYITSCIEILIYEVLLLLDYDQITKSTYPTFSKELFGNIIIYLLNVCHTLKEKIFSF